MTKRRSILWALTIAALASGAPAAAQNYSCFERYLGSAAVNPNSWIVQRMASIDAWREARRERLADIHQAELDAALDRVKPAINAGAWDRLRDRLIKAHEDRLDFTEDLYADMVAYTNDHANRLAAKCDAEEEEVGALSFVLTWTSQGDSELLGPDIDIWVQDPKGNALTSERRAAFGPTDEGGHVDRDDEAGYAESGDIAIGGGPERVTWPVSAPDGSYSFGCNHYEGDGTAECTIEVIYAGETVGQAEMTAGSDVAFLFDTQTREITRANED